MDRGNASPGSKSNAASLVTLFTTAAPLLAWLFSAGLPAAQSTSLPLEPQCSFPPFLQTKHNKPWMINLSDSLTTFDVDGGRIFARSGSCARSRDQPRRPPPATGGGGAECVRSNYTRVCVEVREDSKYLVRRLESTFDMFECLEFLPRSVSVVQLKMSSISPSLQTDPCHEGDMRVDPWPWISEEHYRSAPVPCPFTGGYNLLLRQASPPSTGHFSSSVMGGSGSQNCHDGTTAPIRLESDCVTGEGVVFNFKHPSCLPAGAHLSLHQRALCMATWQAGRELFTMLRADNNDRAFFCLRATLQPEGGAARGSGRAERHGADGSDLREAETEAAEPALMQQESQITEMALYAGWVCPGSGSADAQTALTPHMELRVLDRPVIREPCSDELTTCHNYTSFCRQLQCMRTCGKCVPTSAVVAPPTTASRNDPEASPLLGPYGSEARPIRLSRKATVLDEDGVNVRHAKSGWGDLGRPLENPSGEGDAVARGGEGPFEARLGGGGLGGVHSSVVEPARPPMGRQHRCSFPREMSGTWLQRNTDGVDERIVITEHTFVHPRLGHLECVTFTSPDLGATPLRRVLWSRYDNGCYPRFTCMHYNTPAKAVMRYRLANVQHWPLQLADDSICDDMHFMDPPDMYQPDDKYVMRGWEVMRRESQIQPLACILPDSVPKVVSFVDHRGYSGCLVHSTYYSPRAITVTVFPKSKPGKSAFPSAAAPSQGRGEGEEERRDAKGDGAEHGERGAHRLAGTWGEEGRGGGGDGGGALDGGLQRGGQGSSPSASLPSDKHDLTGHRDEVQVAYENKEHEAWSHKFSKDPRAQVFHNFPPGMSEHDLNRTFLYLNGHVADREPGDLVGPGQGQGQSEEVKASGKGEGGGGRRAGGRNSDYSQGGLADAAYTGTGTGTGTREGRVRVGGYSDLSAARHKPRPLHSGSHSGNVPPRNEGFGSAAPEGKGRGVERGVDDGPRSRPGLPAMEGMLSIDDYRHRLSYAFTGKQQQQQQQQQPADSLHQHLGSKNHHNDNVNDDLDDTDDEDDQDWSLHQSGDGGYYRYKHGDPDPTAAEQEVRYRRTLRNDEDAFYDFENKNDDGQGVSTQETEGRVKSSTLEEELQRLKGRGRRSIQRAQEKAEEEELKEKKKTSYDCLAVMTYVDSYKSLLTATSGNQDQVLCWLVVDQTTVVILNTSSCNSQMAQRVLAAYYARNPVTSHTTPTPVSPGQTDSTHTGGASSPTYASAHGEGRGGSGKGRSDQPSPDDSWLHYAYGTSSTSRYSPAGHAGHAHRHSPARVAGQVEEKLWKHVHRILFLGKGEQKCEVMFPGEQVRSAPIEFRDEDKNWHARSGGGSLRPSLSPARTLSLSILVLLNLVLVNGGLSFSTR